MGKNRSSKKYHWKMRIAGTVYSLFIYLINDIYLFIYLINDI